jgi:CHAT domain-containing protein
LEAKDVFLAAQQQGDYAKTIAAYEQSANVFEQLGDGCEAAISENWAVQYLPDVGKIAQSRARLAMSIADAESRKFKLMRSSALYWLAIGDFRQNRLSESNKNFKSALRLAEEDNNIFEIQHAREALAWHYSVLGEIEPALTYAGTMLSAKGFYYESPNQSLRNLGTLADLSLKLKFFFTSLSFSQEALNIAKAVSLADRRVISNLRRMVKAAAAKGDFRAALNYAGEAKQIALAHGDSAENRQILAEFYLSLADVKRQMKDCDAALADYDQSLDLYLQLPEFTVSSYQIHKGKLFCFQQLDRSQEFSRELKTVLALSEDYRSTIREDVSRQAFFASEQEVFDAAIANALKEGDSKLAFAFVEESRARSLLDFVESGKPLTEVETNFASVAHPLSLTEIQARLPEQVQLVQYAVLPEKLAIWIVSKTRFDLIEMPITAGDLDKRLDNYQTAILRKAPALDLQQAARELYDLLIPPNLAGDKLLCLVPDKFLHQLAFASLVSASGEYLLEDHALFYAPSASVLVLASENARSKSRFTNESLLSIGNPDFDREENPNLADLESAEAEARSIAGDYAKSIQLLGAEATRDKFLHNFAEVDVIHFAGHFLANRQSPANSKLLFAGAELRSSELGTYRLSKAKLVVLSACETGFEHYDQSEGAIGIARMFLAMGAPLVVASQWKVESESTRDLMIAFHRNRRANRLISAESLRRAQLELLRNEQTKAPYYWAAFSLFGGYANY